MQAQEHRPTETPRIEPVPDEIESAQAKLVYVYLAATGSATVDELRETLALKKVTLLSVLRSLMRIGVVEKDGSTYVVTA
ncbi:helix-turn-helix domain-containing protein [Halopiger thermotolerans]